MAKKKPPQLTKDEMLRKFFYPINSWNAGLLAQSFEEWLERYGYEIVKKGKK